MKNLQLFQLFEFTNTFYWIKKPFLLFYLFETLH